MKLKFIPARNIVTALSLTVACSIPVMAQSTTGSGADAGGSTTGATSTQTSPDNTHREKDRDYGWIGLLGLAGLLGLRRKHVDHTVTRPSTTTSR